MGADARPRVLLLHGFLSGKAAWRRTRVELAPDVDTIAPDLPGYGSARDPAEAYSLDWIVDNLDPILAANSPTHVVGHSMGGIVALALAARLPNAFQAVGVIGLPVFRDRGDGLACLRRRGPLVGAMLQDDRLAHLACVGMRHTWPLWLPFAPLALPGRPRHAVRHLFDHSGASHAGSLDAVVFGGLVEALAAQLTVPVAALHGGRDRSAPAQRVRELGVSLGWDVRTAPRLGHQIPIVRPALTARWIREHVLPIDAKVPAMRQLMAAAR